MLETKKVLFVGDNHISGKTPSNRLGNYLEHTLAKLNDCLEIGLNRKLDAVVLLGDLFDIREVSPEARNLTLNLLKSQPNGEKWPFPVYITVGNHDIQTSFPLDKSSLGTLIAAGVLIKEDYVPELGIAFAHFEADLDNNIKQGLLASHPAIIWSCHASIGDQNSFEEFMIPFENIPVHENNSLIISGHIHHPMSCTREDGKRFVNPGAIGRTAATKDNFKRDLKVYLLEYDLSGKIYSEEYIKLPSAKPFNEVFKLDQIAEKKSHIAEVKEFVKSVSQMKTTSWLNTNLADKLKLLEKDAKEKNLDDDVIKLIIEAVETANRDAANRANENKDEM